MLAYTPFIARSTAGQKYHLNPMGFTIVVEEVGHNPNHSYYDYK